MGRIAWRLAITRIPSLCRPSRHHVPRKIARLRPQRRSAVLAARRPALGQLGEIGQRDRQPSLVKNREKAPVRPQHESRSAVGALERRPFVAGRLMEMLFFGVQLF